MGWEEEGLDGTSCWISSKQDAFLLSHLMIFLDSLISISWKRTLGSEWLRDLPKVTGFRTHCLVHYPGLTEVWALSFGWWKGMDLKEAEDA